MIFLWVFKHKNLSRQRVMSHLKAPPGPRLLASNSYRWEAVTSEVTPGWWLKPLGWGQTEPGSPSYSAVKWLCDLKQGVPSTQAFVLTCAKCDDSFHFRLLLLEENGVTQNTAQWLWRVHVPHDHQALVRGHRCVQGSHTCKRVPPARRAQDRRLWRGCPAAAGRLGMESKSSGA